MTDAWGNLRIEVRDDTGRSKPGLIAKSRSGRWQQGTPMTQAEFHARAWKLANDKARELGWIV
jgi:hypothetical protein